MAFTAYPAAGAKLRSSVLQALIAERMPLLALKTADESVTSNTTVQNDDELFLSVIANAKYSMALTLIYEAATASDIKWGFTFPSAATMTWGQLSLDVAATAVSGDVRAPAFGSATSGTSTLTGGGAAAASQLLAVLRGTLIVGANAGTLQLQWAQATSGGTATIVKTNSTLELRRFA